MFSSFLKAALILGIAPVFGEITWKTDLDSALIEAANKKKPVFVGIIASDWSVDCVSFKRAVLNTEKFAKAKENEFIFVELDFPHKKEIDPEQKKKNDVWRNKLGIRGLPTVVLMDDKGLPYASLVGAFNDPDDFLEVLTIVNKNRGIRDKALEVAETTTGKAQIRALVSALKSVPEESRHTFYANEMKKLEELDKDDSTGFIKQQNYKTALFKQEREIYNELDKYRKEFLDGKTDNMMKRVREMLKEEKWMPESRQKLLLATIFFKKEGDDAEEVVKQLNAIIELEPRSQEAAMARNMIRNYQEEGKVDSDIPLHGSVPRVNIQKGKK